MSLLHLKPYAQYISTWKSFEFMRQDMGNNNSHRQWHHVHCSLGVRKKFLNPSFSCQHAQHVKIFFTACAHTQTPIDTHARTHRETSTNRSLQDDIKSEREKGRNRPIVLKWKVHIDRTHYKPRKRKILWRLLPQATNNKVVHKIKKTAKKWSCLRCKNASCQRQAKEWKVMAQFGIFPCFFSRSLIFFK